MQLNKECMKAVLNFVDDNTGVKDVTDSNFIIETISISSIIKGLSSTFQKEDIAYAVLYIKRNNYAFVHLDEAQNKVISANSYISDITPCGRELLNSMNS